MSGKAYLLLVIVRILGERATSSKAISAVSAAWCTLDGEEINPG